MQREAKTLKQAQVEAQARAKLWMELQQDIARKRGSGTDIDTSHIGGDGETEESPGQIIDGESKIQGENKL